MDGAYYNDTRFPFFTADLAPVTLATTDKALYPKDNFPVLGGNYFGWVGTAIRIRLFGKITTVATPGNGTFDVYYGSGVDATGTILASSATFALTANQTNLSWEFEIRCRCTAYGSSGALYVTGQAMVNNAVVANTLQPLLIPASAAAAVGSLDLTTANIISVQFKRSGSTAETMTVQDMEVISLD